MALQFHPDYIDSLLPPYGLQGRDDDESDLLRKSLAAKYMPDTNAAAPARPMTLPDSIDPSATRWVSGPYAEKQREADAKAARETRTTDNETQRLHMERARTAAALQEKGFTLDSSGNLVPLPPAAGLDPSLHGDDALAKLPPNIASRVKQLLDGRSMLTAREKGQPLGQQLMDAANQVDPTFDEAASKARFAARQQFTGAGKASVIAQSGNRLAQHINDLYTASEDLPGPDLGFSPLSNAVDHVSNWFHQPTVAKYNTTLPFISGELQKLTKNGTATVDETRHIMENLSPAQPKDVRRAAIQQLVQLAQGQFQPFRDSWASAWQGTTAPPPPMDFNDTTTKIFDNITASGKPIELDHNGHIVGAAATASSGPGGGAPGGNGGPPPSGGPIVPPGFTPDEYGADTQSRLSTGDDKNKVISIPDAMQAEYTAFIRNQGNRAGDPAKYAAFRAGLDAKNGFGSAAPGVYEDEAKRINDARAKGQPVNLSIPPVSQRMTGQDKLNASIFNNPVGAAVMGAGSMGGGADEVFGTGKALLTGGDISSNIAGMNAMRQAAAEEYPGYTMAGNLAGAALTGYAAGGVPLLAGATESGLGTAALGAGYGGITGALENNDNRLGGAITGALAGGAGGLAGKYALAPVAERIGRSATGQKIADLADAVLAKVPGRDGEGLSRLPPPDMTPADKAIIGVSPNLDSVRANLSDAVDLGLPYALVDADPKLRMLGGAVTRKSVDARDLAERTFDPRAADQGDRAIQAIEQHLSPTVDIGARQQQWRDVAKAQAGPLYDQAFQGGSTAPLESQFTDAFNASSKAVADARAELSSAQQNLTQAQARTSRAGDNVYMNANALPAARDAQAAVDGAQQRLAQAEAQHAQVTSQLRQSQGDAASAAPGAVWNPRLQQFIDDPLSQTGLARGLEIQRLEALAAGKPFDPTEYAVVGYDQGGKPIVGDVPNMRTMDAIKQGYDAILDDYPRDMKGNQIFDKRGRAITLAKNALVSQLDDLNPTYAQARDTFGTFAGLGDTLGEGYAAAPRGTYARDIAPQLDAMTDAQRGEYQAGYATRLRDMVSDASDSSDPYKLLYGGNERRAKIDTVFPEGAPQFDRQYQLEQDMAKTRNETLGGSPTAGRLQADSQLGDNLGETAVNAGVQALTSGGVPLAGTMFNLARRYLGDSVKLGVGKAAEQRAAQLAPVLFDINDPRYLSSVVDDLASKQAAQDARDALYQKYGALFGSAALPSVAVGP